MSVEFVEVCSCKGCSNEPSKKTWTLFKRLGMSMCDKHTAMFDYITRTAFQVGAQKGYSQLIIGSGGDVIEGFAKRARVLSALIKANLPVAPPMAGDGFLDSHLKVTRILNIISNEHKYVLELVFLQWSACINTEKTLDAYDDAVQGGNMSEQQYVERCNILKTIHESRQEYQIKVEVV